MDERREGKERRECSTDSCQYHMLTETIIHDLKDATAKLMEGQEHLRETVTKLVEGFKFMDKLDSKVDRLEKEMKEDNEKQDVKIDKLKGFMYKTSGIAIGISAVLAAIIPILVVFI